MFMDLITKSTECKQTIRVKEEDKIFAIHALAVLELHHELRENNVNKTVRELCQLDQHLKPLSNTVLFNYLVAFGQYGIPTLRNFLSGPTNLSEDDITRLVSQCKSDLESRL